jgi:magnesium-transporting ATPase (P-type)
VHYGIFAKRGTAILAPGGTIMTPEQEPRTNQAESVRHVARWIVLLATAAWGIFAGSFLAYHSLGEGFVVDLAKRQFGAMMLVPMAALVAFCVVTMLEWTAGEIKFKGLSFEFEGASGPIVLWAFCFLAIVAALRVFWVT